jgi:hypothetical protein
MAMTAIGYIPHTEENVNAFRLTFQHDGAATIQLSPRPPVPPAFTAKDLPGGQTQVLNVHLFRTIDHHSVECDEDVELIGRLDITMP